MKEVVGELWSYLNKPNHVICITTNGVRKKDTGELVMGRGCAKEAKVLFPWLPKLLGDQVDRHGNIPVLVSPVGVGHILNFPTKHKWFESSDMELIKQSAEHLKGIALKHAELTFILPRPGCGNGGLKWEDVKPVIVGVLPDNVVIISK